MRNHSSNLWEWECSNLLVAVCAVSCICLLLATFMIFRSNQQKEQQSPPIIDDTQDYLVDFAGLFGPEWVTGTIRQEKEGDNIATTNIFGRDRSIIGRSDYGTHNQTNSLAYFRQYVFLFTAEAEVNEHFDKEREWIFVYDYGVPISRQEYPFRDLELPSDFVFQADEYQVACSETPIDNRCNALLRYGNYIVFVDAFLIRDSVQYLTESDLIAALELINEKMNSRRDLITPQ